MLWINPEDFKNSPEMHNIPSALTLCNGLGMGGCRRSPGEGKFSCLGLFLCCARENVGACSELPYFPAEDAGEKKRALFKLLDSHETEQNKRKNVFGGKC